MSKGVSSPHDKFVRHCMGDIELAKDFFRRFLGPKQMAEIDLDQLQSGGKESFVDDDLREMTTDLLFQAPIHHHAGYLSLMVEHKSEGAARGSSQILPFQMRSQEIKIMEYGRRNHPKKRYPLVYMLGLYHGAKLYAGPKAVGEHIDAPASMIPSRWNEPIELIDLSAYSDKDLIADGKLGVFLLVLKHIYATDILQTLEFLAPQMQRIEQEQGDGFILTVFKYLYEALRVENHEPVIHIAIKTFSKETGDKMLTIAESLRQEGKREGIQEGIQEKTLQVAKRMLAKQEPFEYIMELTDLTMDQIQALAKEKDQINSNS